MLFDASQGSFLCDVLKCRVEIRDITDKTQIYIFKLRHIYIHIIYTNMYKKLNWTRLEIDQCLLFLICSRVNAFLGLKICNKI